jgi:hypothetical protein
MNRFKIQLSKFDIGMIAAFVVIGLLGAAAWWYLSGQLQAAQTACTNVAGDYNSYATSKGIIVSQANAKALAANSALLQTQIDPIISTTLLSKQNDLSNVSTMDPVAWKHELDDDVKTLTGEARNHSVTLKDKFYFGFSRYLTESPSDAATAVLTKQRKAVKTLAEILINSQVKSIASLRRSYEEDAHSGPGSLTGGDRSEADQVSGYAVVIPDTYTAYPFEMDFDASPEALRAILDGLLKSPYLFVLRRIEVHNEQLDSPRVDDLSRMAGNSAGTPSLISTGPGDAAAASAPAPGAQHLFGYGALHVKMRVDMIEWNPQLKDVASLNQKKKQP